MANSELFRIPGTVTVKHSPQHRAVLVTWESLCTPQFREGMTRALAECGRLGAKSWVADLTRNPGVPSQADLAWLGKDAGPLTADAGIKAVINVHGSSAVTKLGSNRWSKGANAGGLLTLDCKSLAEALDLATDVSMGKLRPDDD